MELEIQGRVHFGKTEDNRAKHKWSWSGKTSSKCSSTKVCKFLRFSNHGLLLLCLVVRKRQLDIFLRRNFGLSRFEINRLHSKDWNNTAIQMTTNEGLAKVSFCSQHVNELEVITADILCFLASSHCNVASGNGFTNTNQIESFKKRSWTSCFDHGTPEVEFFFSLSGGHS